MLLSSITLLLLITCIFGFKQSLDLNKIKTQDEALKRIKLNLALVQAQYRENLTVLNSSLSDKEELSADLSKLLNEIQQKNDQIRLLQNEIENLKIDLECSQEYQINEDLFQEVIEAHVLNVLSSICLQDAYENACSYHDLEISIEDLVK